MKQSIGDISLERLWTLVTLYASLVPDGRATAESRAVKAKQVEDELAKMRQVRGLSEADSCELSVTLEWNRRHVWQALKPASAAQPPAQGAVAQPPVSPAVQGSHDAREAVGVEANVEA